MPDKEEEQQHIQLDKKDEDEEKKDTGTGGLLSKIGDPAGKSHIPSTSLTVFLQPNHPANPTHHTHRN
jgi:hypothetical protein